MSTKPLTILINLGMLLLGLAIINTVAKRVPVVGPLVGKVANGF